MLTFTWFDVSVSFYLTSADLSIIEQTYITEKTTEVKEIPCRVTNLKSVVSQVQEVTVTFCVDISLLEICCK